MKKLFVIYVILSVIIFGGLACSPDGKLPLSTKREQHAAQQRQPEPGKEETEQKQQKTNDNTELFLLDKAILQIENCHKDSDLLMQYIQNNPEEEQWVNIYLGLYYIALSKYADAEEYLTRATRFDYSKVDGLLLLAEKVLPNKTQTMSQKQIREAILGCWKRIKEELPYSITVDCNIALIKNTSLDSINPAPYLNVIDRDPRSGLYSEYEGRVWRTLKLTPPHRIENDTNHPLYRGKRYLRKEQFYAAIIYYKSFAYDFYLWPAYPTVMNLPQIEGDVRPSEIYGHFTDYAPALFNMVAKCYIQKAEKLKKQINDIKNSSLSDQSRKETIGQKKAIFNEIIEEYKKAIYFYYKKSYIEDCYNNSSVRQGKQIPLQVTQLRQRIKELESQLKQDKPPK